MPRLLFKYLKNLWHQAAESNNLQLRELITTSKKATILDVGCDDGRILVERVSSKIKSPILYGIDISLTKINLAKKRGIKTKLHDAEKPLPYPDRFFDIVTANQIIEHLVNIDQFVAEIYRVLKPGGYALVSTENLSSWHNIGALILGWQAFSQHLSTRSAIIGNPLRLYPSKPVVAHPDVYREEPTFDPHSMHIKLFTLRGLKELFQIHGFQIEAAFGAGYYPLPALIAIMLAKLDPTHSAFIGIKVRKTKECL